MAQQAFTTEGVELKLDELYALSDSQLQVQANLIETDFRDWMKDNFVLNTSQANYLDNMDDRWIAVTAGRVSLAVRNRLPVTLDTPLGYPNNIQYASKLVRSEDNIVAEEQPSGYSVSGEIRITITY